MSAMTLKHLKLEDQEGVAIVDFIDSALMFETALIREIADELDQIVNATESPRILLDFDRVQYMSSSMLAQLVKLTRNVEKAGGQLRLTGLGPVLRDTIRIGHFEPLFNIYDSRAEALKAFRP